MPSRFLDVANPNAMDRVFLMIRGEDTPAGVQYVALSHCWGKVKTIHTTRSSVDLHRSGIDIQALPQTFQDAIQTTRALGLRYMWIDSLCIVQDDARDWEAEAARMADVYRNAHLVLGATRADADVAGFLGPRPTPTHSTALGAFRLTLLPPLLERWTQGADLVGADPLSARAWCLQERYLARRMLHYGTVQAGWECAELRASEDGDAILDQGDRLFRVLQTANTGVSVFGQVVSSVWANADSLLRSESRHKYSGWYELVSHYSAREITKDTDRLPALLGIASALKVVTGDDYLYGAWHGGLLEGLTWCPSAKGGLSRPEKPIAPSWSWASVKGKVEFPIYAWYELCESDTEQTALIPVARYTIQDASRGIIRLQAPIVRVATRRPRQGHVNTPDDPTSDFREYLVTDTVFQLYPRQYGDPTGCAWWLEGAFDTRPDSDSRDDELHVAFLTRLPYVQANRIYEQVLGLVIRKSSNSTSYERLGFVDSWVQETRGNMVSMVEGPDKLFAEVHGSKHPLQRVSDVLHAAIAEIELAQETTGGEGRNPASSTDD
ncbi:putative HET domain-containing protein [Rosellinia necatrix]|uniref:Putative HET domain-containing protein n=1 Tax=Rosellinia necatrix TaxID=77044 RepID=A0A1S8A987_ROSNE|nr:putative HET domain-containing protein [Rosellinia necatrix]